MLDIDYGCYPYVTSSSVMPSSVHRIDKFIGVMKAYSTRVGDGPPYHPDIPEIREKGNEFGTTTGRQRKCTWNDLNDLDYAISIVQPDEIVVTKLDILKDMEICVYKNGSLIKIGNLDTYKQFLLDSYPQIKWFSESPGCELIKVR
jgi:adenylosuccinate synthase